MKLEIGTHKKIGGEWVTMDISPPADFIGDVSSGLPFLDCEFSEVYMCHVLEHIAWYKTDGVLKEVYRVLEVGGVVEIHVPDIDKIIGAYLGGEIPEDWFVYNEGKDLFTWFAGRVFTYGENDFDFHKAIFNEAHLSRCLKSVGFKNIKLVGERESRHGYINLGMRGVK